MEQAIDTSDPLHNFLTDNPLATIWYKPRVTFRKLITSSPEKYVILFASLSGIYRTLAQAITRGLSDQFSLPWLLIIVFLGGALLGIVSLYFTGIALHFVGMLLGGEGKPEHIRTVIAWSSIPDAILLILTFPVVPLGGAHWLISNPETRDLIAVIFSQLVLLPLIIIFFVWRTAIFIGGLTEVNEFPIWKTLITVVIGYIVMFIPFICLVGMFMAV